MLSTTCWRRRRHGDATLRRHVANAILCAELSRLHEIADGFAGSRLGRAGLPHGDVALRHRQYGLVVRHDATRRHGNARHVSKPVQRIQEQDQSHIPGGRGELYGAGFWRLRAKQGGGDLRRRQLAGDVRRLSEPMRGDDRLAGEDRRQQLPVGQYLQKKHQRGAQRLRRGARPYRSSQGDLGPVCRLPKKEGRV